jgi:hypothetical protein
MDPAGDRKGIFKTTVSESGLKILKLPFINVQQPFSVRARRQFSTVSLQQGGSRNVIGHVLSPQVQHALTTSAHLNTHRDFCGNNQPSDKFDHVFNVNQNIKLEQDLSPVIGDFPLLSGPSLPCFCLLWDFLFLCSSSLIWLS